MAASPRSPQTTTGLPDHRHGGGALIVDQHNDVHAERPARWTSLSKVPLVQPRHSHRTGLEPRVIARTNGVPTTRPTTPAPQTTEAHQ